VAGSDRTRQNAQKQREKAREKRQMLQQKMVEATRKIGYYYNVVNTA
jgi:hypothetical protein